MKPYQTGKRYIIVAKEMLDSTVCNPHETIALSGRVHLWRYNKLSFFHVTLPPLCVDGSAEGPLETGKDAVATVRSPL